MSEAGFTSDSPWVSLISSWLPAYCRGKENPTRSSLLSAETAVSFPPRRHPHRIILLSSAQRRFVRPNIQPGQHNPAEEAFLYGSTAKLNHLNLTTQPAKSCKQFAKNVLALPVSSLTAEESPKGYMSRALFLPPP
jgi:hypothetical protein